MIKSCENCDDSFDMCHECDEDFSEWREKKINKVKDEYYKYKDSNMPMKDDSCKNYVSELEQQINQITAMENVAVERTVRLEKEKAELLETIEKINNTCCPQDIYDIAEPILKKYSGE